MIVLVIIWNNPHHLAACLDARFQEEALSLDSTDLMTGIGRRNPVKSTTGNRTHSAILRSFVSATTSQLAGTYIIQDYGIKKSIKYLFDPTTPFLPL